MWSGLRPPPACLPQHAGFTCDDRVQLVAEPDVVLKVIAATDGVGQTRV